MSDKKHMLRHIDRDYMGGVRDMVKHAQINRRRADEIERSMPAGFRKRSTMTGISEEAVMTRATIADSRGIASELLQRAARDLKFMDHPKRAAVMDAEAERQNQKWLILCRV